MVFENFLPANMDNEVVIGHRLRRCVLVVVHLAQMIPSDGVLLKQMIQRLSEEEVSINGSPDLVMIPYCNLPRPI